MLIILKSMATAEKNEEARRHKVRYLHALFSVFITARDIRNSFENRSG